MELHITLTNSPKDADDNVISNGLSSYNKQFSSGTAERLSVYARDANNDIIGGLIGISYGNWLHVEDFWVSEQHREQSIGSKVLAAAEKEAVERKCVGVTLDTYSFQALPFYLKRGYEQFGSLPGYAGKFERHYLKKIIMP